MVKLCTQNQHHIGIETAPFKFVFIFQYLTEEFDCLKLRDNHFPQLARGRFGYYFGVSFQEDAAFLIGAGRILQSQYDFLTVCVQGDILPSE